MDSLDTPKVLKWEYLGNLVTLVTGVLLGSCSKSVSGHEEFGPVDGVSRTTDPNVSRVLVSHSDLVEGPRTQHKPPFLKLLCLCIPK